MFNPTDRQMETTQTVTEALARRIRSIRYEELPPAVVTVARQCILDWVMVTLRAVDDPLVVMLVDQVLAEGGKGQASLVGRAVQVSARQAALVNGSASHALDYDDVNIRMTGHPTVAVLPAALALAESIGASGKDLIAAFVAGYETACLVGGMVAPGHYARGFHVTGTVGTFGAAAACAHLMGLGHEQTRTALGIAGTQAAGLKSMFGTMCKPLHAGKACESGLLAAQLAARGFTSRADVIECAGGFAATQTDSFDPGVVLGLDAGRYNLPDNLFKYHASCYQTHAAIEAIRSLHATHGFAASDIERIVLRQDAGADTVCNIPRPSSGLETKFSLRLLAAYAVTAVDTADIDSYTDALTHSPELVALRDKVEVGFVADWPITRSEVTIHLIDGRTLYAAHDSGVPDTDLARQTTRLLEKLDALVGARLGASRTRRLAATILAIEDLPQLGTLIDLLGPIRH
jgi:2-methylcitrate dehydratase PrpD